MTAELGPDTQEVGVAEEDLSWLEVMSAVQMMMQNSKAQVSDQTREMRSESNPLFEAVSAANESAEPVTAVMMSVDAVWEAEAAEDAVATQSAEETAAPIAYCSHHIDRNQILAEPVTMSGATVTEAIGAVGLRAKAADGSMDAADGAAIQATERMSTVVAKAGLSGRSSKHRWHTWWLWAARMWTVSRSSKSRGSGEEHRGAAGGTSAEEY